jgi:hypothetical protein
MIMCDTAASGITAELNDSYLERIEPRANGGVLVLWTDLPERAMVFADAAAAEEFCRDSPLEMFVVSFVPVSGALSPAAAPPPRESEADFLERLHQLVVDAEAGKTAAG